MDQHPLWQQWELRAKNLGMLSPSKKREPWTTGANGKQPWNSQTLGSATVKLLKSSQSPQHSHSSCCTKKPCLRRKLIEADIEFYEAWVMYLFQHIEVIKLSLSWMFWKVNTIPSFLPQKQTYFGLQRSDPVCACCLDFQYQSVLHSLEQMPFG